MQAYQAYKKNAVAGWSRIEMLIALYDATLASLDAGVEALRREDAIDWASQQIRVSRLLLALLEGIDPEQGELALKCRDLCIYSMSRVAAGTVESWSEARNVLSVLHSAFLEIRDEAIQLESQGVIPPMRADTGPRVYL